MKFNSPGMRHRKLIGFTALSAVIAICIHLWDRESSAPDRPESRKSPAVFISFHGYSNAINGEKWALLIITNRDSCDITLLGPYTVEFEDYHEGDDKLDDQARWDFPNSIACGTACRASIRIPPDPRRWKAHCVAQRNGWQSKVRDIIPDRLGWLVPGSSGEELGGLVTEWISP